MGSSGGSGIAERETAQMIENEGKMRVRCFVLRSRIHFSPK